MSLSVREPLAVEEPHLPKGDRLPLSLQGDTWPRAAVTAAFLPAELSEGRCAACAGFVPGARAQGGVCAAALLRCHPFSSTLAGLASASSVSSFRLRCPGDICGGFLSAPCRFPAPCMILNEACGALRLPGRQCALLHGA